MSQPVTGRFTAAGQVSAAFEPFGGSNDRPTTVNWALWRDDAVRARSFDGGLVAVQRSFDLGQSWHDLEDDRPQGSVRQPRYLEMALSGSILETEYGVRFRLLAVAYTGTPINYRLSA